MAQTQFNYDTRWKSVDAAFKKGLNATAEKEIAEILKFAKAENNTEQIIKAICNYRISLRDRDEKARLNDILFFEEHLKSAAFPVKQILHSMMGDLYWAYYEENRWDILDRTTVENTEVENSKIQNSKDIETWSANDFYDAAYRHFNASLSESGKSKAYSVTQIAAILEKGKNTEKLRPTLYDFLVHRAIDYFKQDENDITKPAYAFEINDEKAFAPAADFIKATFKTSDTLSKKYRVLNLYREVLNFHYQDTDPSALIDADIARILFVNEKSTLPNKADLYLKALKTIAKQYPNNASAAMATFYIAENFTKGENKTELWYDETPVNNLDKIDNVSAKKLCDEILEKFPGSEAAYKAKVLLQQIESHSLSFQNEKAILPGKPSLALVQYKNIKTIYCKIVKLTVAEYKENNPDQNENLRKIKTKTAIKEWNLNLPDKNDFQTHSTEIKIDALPIGIYAILISEKEDYSEGNHTILSYLRVSNLSYILGNKNNGGGTGIYVVHRESGKPLENVIIKTWNNTYDYQKRKTVFNEGPTYKSDKNGYARLNKKDNNSAFVLELIQGDDDLYLNDAVYVNEYEARYNDLTRTFFFTDRSIYRPGQTIFFKGIMTLSKGNENKQHELLKNKKTSVKLLDANYQIVKTEEFTTNEYGSFAGSFQAPEGLLTGQFHIEGENGTAYFNIEEYKRPKFEVNFDTLKGSYRINDIVNVKGLTKAFAGNVVDGASVKYRVFRQARFPYYWSYYRWGQPASSRQEITNGHTMTNADGSFDISFKAIPDASVNKESMPVFDYQIEADVTDLNGETRSGSTRVSVSYQSLVLKIEVPGQIDFNDFNALHIYSSNLSGTHVATNVTLSLKKLTSPGKIYRTRMWKQGDLKSISEAEFRKDFPDDEYNDENNYLKWKEEKTIWTKTISTTAGGLEYLQKTVNNDGWYVIEAKAKDKDGQEVMDKKYIRLSTYSDPVALPNEHLLITKVKTSAEPGQTARFGISNAYKNIFVLYSLNRNQESTSEWLELNSTQFFDYKITEQDRGGFDVGFWFVKNNRYYQTLQFIEVPWTNKDLKITLETFRDKMLPGSEQEWKLKISGTQKEKVSAELLATMYDASLDAFKPHRWGGMGLFQNNYIRNTWNGSANFSSQSGRQIYYYSHKNIPVYEKSYHELKWWGLRHEYRDYWMRGMVMKNVEMADASEPMRAPVVAQKAYKTRGNALGVSGGIAQEEMAASATADSVFVEQPVAVEAVPLRSNFSETAFFFPQLQTDAAGNIILKFKVPESLTRWKLMAFGHTTDLKSGSLSETAVTQKELMIVPNTPRFLREGDKMMYSAKVTNLSDQHISGTALLQLYDALTEKPVDDLFLNQKPGIAFNIKKGESQSLVWSIEIPQGYTNPVMVKTLAQAGDVSDGEQNVVPVLLNSMLVTETLPLPVRVNSTKNFSFTNLLNSKNSNTLRHYNLTVEYTSNPAWYAVQALPYLTDYPYECAEQTFNRYYANVLATHIANSSPKIKEIFSDWKDKDSTALLSNLEKNQELKSALLQETPWVLQAKNETEQKKNIAILFNLNRMSKELERTVRELEIMQTPNGGFTWFKGMPDDRFITQYILTGIGRLLHLGIKETGNERRIKEIVQKAIPYLDARLKEDYDYLIRHKANLKNQQISYTQIQYLYMRSFFMEMPVAEAALTAFNFYKNQAAQYWLPQGKYMQGMTALALYRWKDKTTAQAILKSLSENAIRSEEMGMYWKELSSSYWWYEAPIEAQSLLIEAYSEILGNEEESDEMKIWLLKNKQTTNWKTTKATADAIYALLLSGTDWLSTQPDVEISLGDQKINSKDQQQQAGTGYFKTNIPAEEIKAEMGNIQVKVQAAPKPGTATGTTWGAVYWQYFENLDKITSAETPLSLKKQLYITRNSDKGPVLTPITDKTPLQVGDKVKVRIELRVDRDMEYVHMKDMRAACFEPVNVLSNYKYQGGLGYYEATKDAATNFFFHYLQKGTYVFEYPMFVTIKGDFSNGIATIQCMYAPEFSSHSEGIRVVVK